jgi:hypothetical protein
MGTGPYLQRLNLGLCLASKGDQLPSDVSQTIHPISSDQSAKYWNKSANRQNARQILRRMAGPVCLVYFSAANLTANKSVNVQILFTGHADALASIFDLPA